MAESPNDMTLELDDELVGELKEFIIDEKQQTHLNHQNDKMSENKLISNSLNQSINKINLEQKKVLLHCDGKYFENTFSELQKKSSYFQSLVYDIFLKMNKVKK